MKIYINTQQEKELKEKIITEIENLGDYNIILHFKEGLMPFSYSYSDGDLFGWEIDFDKTNFSEETKKFLKDNFQAIEGVPYWESGNNDLWTEGDFEVGLSLFECL